MIQLLSIRQRIIYDPELMQVVAVVENDIASQTRVSELKPLRCVVTDNLQSAEMLLRKRGYTNLQLIEQVWCDYHEVKDFVRIDAAIPAPVMQSIESLCFIPIDPNAQLHKVEWNPVSRDTSTPTAGGFSVVEAEPDQLSYEDVTGLQLISIGLQLEGYDTSNLDTYVQNNMP